jgi:hypothetical protein
MELFKSFTIFVTVLIYDDECILFNDPTVSDPDHTNPFRLRYLYISYKFIYGRAEFVFKNDVVVS